MMELSILEQRLYRYALTPFSESAGPRRGLIVEDLTNAGLSPKVDDEGNVWITKSPVNGDDAAPLIVSSHMDTVFGLDNSRYIFGKSGDESLVGALDNAVGCAINVELAINSQPSVPTYFVFTVNEEKGGGGADEVLKQVKEEDPICITLDVTPDDLGELFNIENIKPQIVSPGLDGLISAITGKKSPVKISGVFDESCVYGRHATAFSVCPVVFGGAHNEVSIMKKGSMEAIYDLVFSLLQREDIPSILDESLQRQTEVVTGFLINARRRIHNEGYEQSRIIYSVANEKWHTYCFLPRICSSEVMHVATGKLSPDFIDKIKKNASPDKIRDELEICLAALSVELEVVTEKKSPSVNYSYTMSFYYPDAHKEMIGLIIELYEERAKKHKRFNYCLELKFDGEAQMSAEIPELFLDVLDTYNMLIEDHMRDSQDASN